MKTMQLNTIMRCSIIFCALLLAGASTRIYAQQEAPGQHPAYLHAIRSLRQARTYLSANYTEPVHYQRAQQAIHEIDEAIGHLKEASKGDDKNLDAVPPPKDMPPANRITKALELLNGAHTYVDMPESNAAAVTYRDQALRDIDAAKAILQQTY